MTTPHDHGTVFDLPHVRAEINRLKRELDEARDEASRAACRAEDEYEIVDAVAALLTEIGRPADEEIADGLRWLIAERDRLRALLRKLEWRPHRMCADCDKVTGHCWICDRCEFDARGHAPDCETAAALGD